MATYYKDLWDYAAILCHLPTWTYNNETYDFAANVDSAAVIQKALNEAIGKIIKERYAPVIKNEEITNLEPWEVLDCSLLKEKLYKVIDVKVNDVSINFEYDLHNKELILSSEYPASTVFSIDYEYMPVDIPLKYDSATAVENPFPDNIVDINIICYYAASAWYKWQGGEEDIKAASRNYDDWYAGFSNIYNPTKEPEVVKNVYGGGIW